MNRLVGANDDGKARAVQRWLGGLREVAAGAGLELRRKPEVWLWTRVAGDVLDLGMLGAVAGSPGRSPGARRRAVIALTAVAGVTVADVVAALQLSGLADGGRNGQAAAIEASGWITVHRPVDEVFAYWRDLENFPQFMAHVHSVQPLGDGRWRWRAAGPAGVRLEWEVEVSDLRTNELIAWRSVGDASVTSWGEVRFSPAPGGRGTEIRVRLSYDLPAGKLAATIAKLFGEAPDQRIRDDLRRFKQVLETGEVVRSEGSPEGTRALRQLFQRPAQPVSS